MNRNPNFCLTKIGTEHYLVPFGQEIENIRSSLRMNEASSLLWEKLSEQTDEKELALALAREYKVPQAELPEIEKDVHVMLRQLMTVGAVTGSLSEKESVPSGSCISIFDQEVWDMLCGEESEYRDIMIGGLRIRLYGSTDYLPDELKDFYMSEDAGRSSEQDIDINIIVTEEKPQETDEIAVIIEGYTVRVLDGGEYYVIRSTETPAIREGHILKDGSRAVIYMGSAGSDGNADGTDAEEKSAAQQPHGRVPNLEETGTDAEQESTPADAVFHMLRHVFMICAEKRDMYIIHSASILHDGRAWLFSALSGTGKSTHTNLWHKLYGTPYLDGDLNLLAFEGGRPVVKGIPWCGTSGIYTTETWPLGGIILLARDPKNYVEELSVGAKVLGISMRFISPKWNEEMLRGVLDFSERIVKSSGICRLHCNMEDEAAEVCRAWIDGREA
ncbi:MAG: PqqD family protein [Lachnospiraceae bacterium]|nr:PqqD family protein [Lachnospiraceae bacterium]